MFKQHANLRIWTWIFVHLTTGVHYVNSYTNRYLCKNSGLSILLHGVISLPDATSCEKLYYSCRPLTFRTCRQVWRLLNASWYICSKAVLLFLIILLFLSCFVMLSCASVIDALWSPAGKGLTSWLSFVMYNCEVVTFPWVSWVRCGAWLYWFLIFALILNF